eukprot:scaffold446_cov183-Ochromonas_danica.AAC.4
MYDVKSFLSGPTSQRRHDIIGLIARLLIDGHAHHFQHLRCSVELGNQLYWTEVAASVEGHGEVGRLQVAHEAGEGHHHRRQRRAGQRKAGVDEVRLISIDQRLHGSGGVRGAGQHEVRQVCQQAILEALAEDRVLEGALRLASMIALIQHGCPIEDEQGL